MKNLLLKSMLVVFVATSISPIKAESSFNYYFPKIATGISVLALAAMGYFGFLYPSLTKNKKEQSDKKNNKEQSKELVVCYYTTAGNLEKRSLKRSRVTLEEVIETGQKSLYSELVHTKTKDIAVYDYEKYDHKNKELNKRIENDNELRGCRRVLLLSQTELMVTYVSSQGRISKHSYFLSNNLTFEAAKKELTELVNNKLPCACGIEREEVVLIASLVNNKLPCACGIEREEVVLIASPEEDLKPAQQITTIDQLKREKRFFLYSGAGFFVSYYVQTL